MHIKQRRARGRLFSASGRQVVLALLVAAALLTGVGVAARHAASVASPLPLAWIGR